MPSKKDGDCSLCPNPAPGIPGLVWSRAGEGGHWLPGRLIFNQGCSALFSCIQASDPKRGMDHPLWWEEGELWCPSGDSDSKKKQRNWKLPLALP